MTMAYGPLPLAMEEDPNGTPGDTAGGVPVTASRNPEAKDPTPGAVGYVPPYTRNPHLDPLDQSFGHPGPSSP